MRTRPDFAGPRERCYLTTCPWCRHGDYDHDADRRCPTCESEGVLDGWCEARDLADPWDAAVHASREVGFCTPARPTTPIEAVAAAMSFRPRWSEKLTPLAREYRYDAAHAALAWAWMLRVRSEAA